MSTSYFLNSDLIFIRILLILINPHFKNYLDTKTDNYCGSFSHATIKLVAELPYRRGQVNYLGTVQWFLKPEDLPSNLDTTVKHFDQHELFLDTSNKYAREVDLESISGKCQVSKHQLYGNVCNKPCLCG